MISVKDYLDTFAKMSSADKKIILLGISKIASAELDKKILRENVKETRFSIGKKCPHCTSDKIKRNGKSKGVQRYLCKDCNRTFNDFTNSPVSYSKKDLSLWINYAKLMIEGRSIRYCAETLGISVPTSFYWRHKILRGLKEYLGSGHLEGVVESDEFFIKESFKGNHSKSSIFKMPRKSHKRGSKAKKRGTSKEQICVSVSIDRLKNIVIEPICRGRVTSNQLIELYRNKISKNATLCSDSHKSYMRFSKELGFTHIRIKSGKKKEGLYHIQHVNGYHSRYREWSYRFHGVATKYLNLYLVWHKWLESFKEDKEFFKCNNLIMNAISAYSKLRVSDLRLMKVKI